MKLKKGITEREKIERAKNKDDQKWSKQGTKKLKVKLNEIKKDKVKVSQKRKKQKKA